MSNEFDWHDEYLFSVHAMIEEHGFFIQMVMGAKPNEPSWGYTIGFLAHGHPEVLVFGLDESSTSGVLHLLYDEIVAGRHRLVGRDHDQEIGAGGALRLLPVPAKHWADQSTRLCTAVSYYQALRWTQDQVVAVQLVWPDPSGSFPWEAGCSPRFRRLQPVLDPEIGRAA